MRITRTFQATDEHGIRHTVNEWAKVIDTSAVIHGQSETLGTARELETSDGVAVRRISKGHYQTITGVTLKSDAPDAP